MHAQTLGFGHHRHGRLRLYFSDRLPDYRATLAFLGGVMSDAFQAYSKPILAIFTAFGVAWSFIYSYVTDNPVPAWTAAGAIAVGTPIVAALCGAYRLIRSTRRKDQLAEFEKNRVKALSDLDAARARTERERLENDHRNAMDEANDKAAYEKRRRQEAENASSYVAQITANAEEIAKLKADREAFEQENRALQADLYREAFLDLFNRGMIPAVPSDVTVYIRDRPVATPVDSVAATLLIVEDHEDTGRQLARFLRHNGWSVKVVTTYAQAVEALEGPTPPACILLDLVLPDGQGVGLIRRIRELGLNTRVVVVTALVGGPIVEAAEALKPDALLTKPVDFSALLRRIGEPPAISTLTLHQRITNIEGVGVEKVDVPGQDTRAGASPPGGTAAKT